MSPILDLAALFEFHAVDDLNEPERWVLKNNQRIYVETERLGRPFYVVEHSLDSVVVHGPLRSLRGAQCKAVSLARS